MSDEQARDYLVVNLGFAAAGICDRYIVIRIRPAFVTGKAFAGLLYWLADQPEMRVMATLYSDEGWQDEILGIGLGCAYRRLIELVPEHGNVLQDPAVLRRSRCPDSLPSNCGLRAALGLWAEIGPNPTPSQLDRLLSGPLNDRFAWVTWSGHDDRLVLTAIGNGLPPCAKMTLSRMVGRPLQDQPDPVYGRYCAETYHQAAEHRQPLLEDIDALVTWPGYGRTRRTYRRLILPFRGPSGGHRLLGASFEDSGIDLRREAA